MLAELESQLGEFVLNLPWRSWQVLDFHIAILLLCPFRFSPHTFSGEATWCLVCGKAIDDMGTSGYV